MPVKKGKPLGRRPEAVKSNITRVAELIPENGIRYNSLEKECDKIGIGAKAMNKILIKLLADRIIVKEAVLTKSRSGTCYRRNAYKSYFSDIPSEALFLPWTITKFELLL